LDRGQKKYAHMLTAFGGALTLVFGLLSAFNLGLAYARVYPASMEASVSLSLSAFHFHEYTQGFLVTSAGGFLGLIASFRKDRKFAYLGFSGIFLGLLGFFANIFLNPRLVLFEWTYQFLEVPSVGQILALLGVSLMFVGFVTELKVHSITLLSVPITLASSSMHLPMILTNNIPLLVSGYMNPALVILSCGSSLIMFSGALIGLCQTIDLHLSEKKEKLRNSNKETSLVTGA